MTKISRLVILAVALSVVVGLLQTSASAHHRPDHQTGKPSPSPSISPSPSPSPTPTPVNVRLEVQFSVGMNLQAGDDRPVKSCSLVVLEGATGEDALKAAVAADCIDSYEAAFSDRATRYYEEYRLVCLDDLCDDEIPTAYWWTRPTSPDPSYSYFNPLTSPWATEGAVFDAYYRVDGCVWWYCV